MITFWTKSLLSLPLVPLALINLFTMFELLGRQNKRFDPKKLRLIHRLVGYLALAWMLLISAFCILVMQAQQQELSALAALHVLTAVVLIVLLFLKLLCVRFYRKLFGFVPPLGIFVFTLLMTTMALSAGSYLLTTPKRIDVAGSSVDSKDLGRRLFASHCRDCHFSDREEAKIGPGLKNLSRRAKLPVSGRPVTAENLLMQLEQPFAAMPSFNHLTEQEKQALVQYLLSL